VTLKKLFFKIERDSSKTVRILFRGPSETKLAFRAVMKFLNDVEGIYLVRTPGYAIILDQEKGAWAAWRRGMSRMISDKFLKTDGIYYIELYNGTLVPVADTPIVPVYSQGCHLPMVVG